MMSLTKSQQETLRALGAEAAVHFDEPMDRHTTMQVGGPADAWAEPSSVEQLLAMLAFAKQEGLPWMVVGRGSNLLVRDGGLRGLVIATARLDALRLEPPVEAATPNTMRVLIAEAGVKIKRLLGFCGQEGLAGVEGLEGVPGTVGGAIVMNAGTPAGVIGDAVLDVTYVEQGVRVLTKTAAQLEFAYRKTKLPRSAVVLQARLTLRADQPEAVKARLQALREKREAAQPATQPGVGSVFRNPEGSAAWRFIDDAGLRGVRVGGARISPQHANWIINEGGATAKDVETLIRLMREKVRERCGISLEPEVVMVGEE